MAYQSTTLAQLRARLQDKWEGRPLWSNEDARTSLNEGLRLWNAMTGMWKTRIQLLTIPRDNYLSLPGTIVRRSRVEFNNKPLDVASLHEMSNGYPNWIGQTILTGGSVPTEPKLWVPISLNLIAIWPADAGLGKRIVTIDGIATTPILVGDADVVDIGDEVHNNLIDYAFHVASFKAGGATFETTMGAKDRFIKAASYHNKQIAASSKFRAMVGADTSNDAQPVNVSQ